MLVVGKPGGVSQQGSRGNPLLRVCEMALGPREAGLQIMEIHNMEIRMEAQI